ncbi:ABC transporter substrate-binding protein [Allonocardiopsis opalescens]|uniref:ABC-type glycerol-3-phosphate transport system substrate-binding protein n=1 Tax=Allonocardiopsis opalescens TaxID=1144618 RepID=A0A2T0PYT2_9ACTN|nr:ABC transporter substrate-binding protein [Allonocardiopsis opalescens]PRX96619.1 ABC-type glycerol-3-phosphate transport system substrate-binding protein [Allonocardiopsis opalescens]
MRDFDRRAFLALAGMSALGASALLSGCGGGSGSGIALRYAWWGNTVRQQNYERALQQFQEANPGITVDPEFAEYTAFQERMTTQMAARNVADIFWIASPQVMTYQAAGLYRPLSDIPTLDLSDYSEADIAAFSLNGELLTMPHGVFVPVVRYNETFLEEDGAELPGEDWNWDQLSEFLIDYAANAPEGRTGASYTPDQDMAFEAWLRQRGQDLWTAEGTVGFDAEALGDWFEWWRVLLDRGAVLSLGEQEGMQPDFADIGERVLVNFGSSNHIIDEAAMFPDWRYRLRSVPVAPDAADGHRFTYYPRLAVYQGIDDEKLEAAGRLIDYNVNNADFLRTVGLTMGAPPNPRLLQEAYDFASEDETEMLAVVEADRAEEQRPRYEAPPGTGTWREALSRASETIALGDSSVSAVAESLIAEIQAGIDQAA